MHVNIPYIFKLNIGVVELEKSIMDKLKTLIVMTISRSSSTNLSNQGWGDDRIDIVNSLHTKKGTSDDYNIHI